MKIKELKNLFIYNSVIFFLLLFLIELILFTSCKKNNGDVIITQDKMVNMLLDLSIIKSINNLNYEKTN